MAAQGLGLGMRKRTEVLSPSSFPSLLKYWEAHARKLHRREGTAENLACPGCASEVSCISVPLIDDVIFVMYINLSGGSGTSVLGKIQKKVWIDAEVANTMRVIFYTVCYE